MDNRYGDMILSYNDFKSILKDFADRVAAKEYEKMEYSMWRNIAKHTDADEVIVSWDEDGLRIVFGGEDTYHFFTWESGFGEFLYWEYIQKDWTYGSMDYIDSDGVMHNIPSVLIRTQSTSSNCYPVKNYKLDLTSAGTFGANVVADKAATSMITMDTKVDKAEFDARIKELNEIIEKHTNKEENKTMKAFNFDFGPVNGNAVRMSMYGLAVKNKVGTFVSYDTKSGEIMDVDVFNFDGANFLYKMPVAMKDIVVGDVVIHHGAPMFVVGKSTDGKGLVVIDVIAGERKEVMLAKSPFGFNFATKVVNFLGNAFNGNVGANADNPFGNMWMLMAMTGDNKDMNEMLPFMMMANGGNIDNNMLMFMAMSGKGGNDMLPMLMMNAMNAPAVAPAHECKCGGDCGQGNH